jgi:DNA-binding MarR family transcriptional regulator
VKIMDRPIGYWLKELDRLIEASFDRALAEDRLTRRHWQVLNALAERPLPVADVRGELLPFDGVDEALADLSARDYVTQRDGTYTLTAGGVAARERLTAQVHAMRARATDGIDAEEYAATVRVLRQMAANLAVPAQ